MKPLKPDALKFEAELSTRKAGTLEYRHLRLRYYVQLADQRVTLVVINLDDTEPYAVEAPHRFWFYYQPLVQPWPEGEFASMDPQRPARSNGKMRSLLRRFPSIELIVCSSVKVEVARQTQQIDRFQSVGVEGLDLDTRLRDAVFSPVRPQITLRRVHREAQIPMLGSAFRLQQLQQTFSFYADAEDKSQFTLQPTLAALIQVGRIEERHQLMARRTWTHVSFDELGTQFTFPESSYQLRVLDQHYDQIDNQKVPADISFEDARSKQHTAQYLVSLPKRFTYDVAMDPTPQLMAGGYQTEGRTTLAILKSQNVHLAGTIVRNTQSDQLTNNLIAELNPRPGQLSRGTDYRDYLPGIAVMDEKRKLIPFDELERSSPPANYEFTKSPGQQFFEFQVSMIIGFTPVAGEVFGLYELYTALAYNEDAFGNKLIGFEKDLVVIAGILPFVPFSALKYLSREFFPMLSETVEKSGQVLARLRVP